MSSTQKKNTTTAAAAAVAAELLENCGKQKKSNEFFRNADNKPKIVLSVRISLKTVQKRKANLLAIFFIFIKKAKRRYLKNIL